MNICWEIRALNPPPIWNVSVRLILPCCPHSTLRAIRRVLSDCAAYEEAQHWAASPAEDVKTEEVGDEHEILVAFRELLASERDRFQPSAWQKFIQQLNQCSMDEIDKLRWQLCDIAMKTETISLSCRHCWRSV